MAQEAVGVVHVRDAHAYTELITLTPLDAAAAFEEIAGALDYTTHQFFLDIVGGSSLVMEIQGRQSRDDPFVNIHADGLSDSLTVTDGPFQMDTTRGLRYLEVRLNWISGTATSVNLRYRGGNF